jgi:hypothetical protein
VQRRGLRRQIDWIKVILAIQAALPSDRQSELSGSDEDSYASQAVG